MSDADFAAVSAHLAHLETLLTEYADLQAMRFARLQERLGDLEQSIEYHRCRTFAGEASLRAFGVVPFGRGPVTLRRIG